MGPLSVSLASRRENRSLCSSAETDGQSEIKQDINWLQKGRESIHFDKDQICCRWNLLALPKQSFSSRQTSFSFFFLCLRVMIGRPDILPSI